MTDLASRMAKSLRARLAFGALFGALLSALVLSSIVGQGLLGQLPGWRRLVPPVTGESEASAAAEDFFRLVADSRRDDDTVPLPCTLVTEPGGLLNPCMDAIRQRWSELEPIEKVGPRLRVTGVTSRQGEFAVVTEADVVPRPATRVSITLEQVGTGVDGWRVRQLNGTDLPR